MSKFIDEIVADIKSNPESWSRFGDDGLINGDIVISSLGNGSKFMFWWSTSIADVSINDKQTVHITSIKDKYKIEEAFLWWIRNASIEMMRK